MSEQKPLPQGCCWLPIVWGGVCTCMSPATSCTITWEGRMSEPTTNMQFKFHIKVLFKQRGYIDESQQPCLETQLFPFKIKVTIQCICFRMTGWLYHNFRKQKWPQNKNHIRSQCNYTSILNSPPGECNVLGIQHCSFRYCSLKGIPPQRKQFNFLKCPLEGRGIVGRVSYFIFWSCGTKKVEDHCPKGSPILLKSSLSRMCIPPVGPARSCWKSCDGTRCSDGSSRCSKATTTVTDSRMCELVAKQLPTSKR